MVVTPRQAVQILNDVENGVTPKSFVMALSPKRNPFFETRIQRDIQLIGESGARFSQVRFLRGSYGDGKTFFLNYVKEKALEQNYVVSDFSISSRGISLDMLERALAEMVKTLTTAGKRAATGKESVLDFIVKRWSEMLADPEDAFSEEVDFDRDARQAIVMLARLLRSPDENREAIAMVNDWFQGKTHPVGALRSKLRVLRQLTAANALYVLKFLAQFFVLAGYRGWVVLVDEQEIVSTLLTPRRRELTDENLRLLIDEQGEIPHAYFLFATTSEFFTDPLRGVNSYPALKSRVTRNNTYDLPPLSKTEMVEIGRNLKDIYAVAEGKPSVLSHDIIGRFAVVADDRLENRSSRARVFVKSFVEALRRAQSGTKVDGDGFRDIVDGVYEEVAAAREEALEQLVLREQPRAGS